MTEEANRAEAPPDRFTALWRRAKEHRIAQWTVGYVAVAYGIQHAVTLTSEAFKWPDAVLRISMLLLVLGLPLAMTLAWYHGERASRRISGAEAAIVSLLLVLISFAFYFVVRPAEQIASRTAPAQTAIASAARPDAISLAVLPFLNLSGDPKEEFFSDGMTEEITSALARIPSLRVVARTSAFEFKGKNEDVRQMGRALGATHFIEGSVRKEGNEVRITAQLIRADDGTHLWTDNYDRELKGVFVVQEDIARAIAASLRVPLGLKQGDSLVSNRAVDPASYQDYLRARALYRARATDEAIADLKQLVVRDRKYAPAWALLASAEMGATARELTRRSGLSIDEARRFAQDSDDRAEMAAREAINLDRQFAGGYARLGGLQYLHYKWVAGENLIKQALALDPTEPETLDFYSGWLANAGRLKELLSLREQLRRLEPFVPAFNINTAGVLLVSGQGQAAIRILEAIPADAGAGGGYLRNLFLANAYAAAGRYSDAADTLLLIRANFISRRSLEDAARIIRAAPTKTKAPEALPALGAGLSFVYAYVGALDRVMEDPERDLQIHRDTGYLLGLLWSPEYAPLRKTERFKALMRNTGLVDYWRAKGWPDLCRPMGADDFVCD